MIIEKSFGGLHMAFRVNGLGKLELLHLGNSRMAAPIYECQHNWYSAADIHITGENQNDHHGGKFSGCSCIDTLCYVRHHSIKTTDGEILQFLLRNKQLQVTLHYQFYSEISAVRCWTMIQNISSEKVGIEYVGSFSLMGIDADTPQEDLRILIAHNGWQRDINWKSYKPSELGLTRTPTLKFSTKRIVCSNTGSWSTKEYLPMGGLARKDAALLWQIESNGSWHWEISDLDSKLYLKLSGPNERENGWYLDLEPNSEFESVKATVAISSDFNGVLGEMTRYRRRIVPQSTTRPDFPVIFNDYMNCLNGDPTEAKELPLIDRAAKIGAECFIIDGGWYSDGPWWDNVGQWQPSKIRWPNGIKTVFDRIRSKGMIPGIWLEIEVMGVHCPLLDQFPDECFFMRHGKRVIDHGRYQLDFRHPKVRAYANSVIDRVVEEYGVGYIKMDYNIDAGIGTEVCASSFGDGLLQHNRAYLDWLDEIQGKYPHLILESCASGSLRMDYGSLAHCTLYSISDQMQCAEMAHTAQQAPTALLPEQAAIWAYPLAHDSENLVVMNLINAMLQRIHLSGQLMDLDEKQLELVQEGVECYKKTRHIIPNAIPFYPLGLPCFEDKLFCVGITTGEKTYLKVWRLDTEKSSLCIPANSQHARVIYPSGNHLQLQKNEQGWNITLPEKFSAVLIELT